MSTYIEASIDQLVKTWYWRDAECFLFLPQINNQKLNKSGRGREEGEGKREIEGKPIENPKENGKGKSGAEEDREQDQQAGYFF